MLDQERIKNLIYICIGTGIGCGLLLNGTLYTGENGFAGELGHISLPSDHTRCACGNEGCLQNIISGPAILKKYNSITKHDNQGIKIQYLYFLRLYIILVFYWMCKIVFWGEGWLKCAILLYRM